jgi:hypothetical protein
MAATIDGRVQRSEAVFEAKFTGSNGRNRASKLFGSLI